MTAIFFLFFAYSALPFAMASDIEKTSTLLFSAISKDCTSKGLSNFVFSPFSILGVFHVAQRGAEGETKKQMDALVPGDASLTLPGFDIPAYEGGQAVIVETANRIYAPKALEKNKYFVNFSREVSQAMGADAKTTDFADARAAAFEINTFVEKKTRGHIKQLIEASSLSSATQMVLINALYFKAPWNSKFDEKKTFEGVFHARMATGRVRDQRVLFMKQRLEEGFTYLKEGNGLTAFSLSYADPRLRLYVYMPDDIYAFEAKIAEGKGHLEDIARRVQHARSWNADLDLSFPKFKLSASNNHFDLVQTFKALGANLMFAEGKADFSGMTGKRDLYVSTYVHQADFAVDEDGTEASAATAIGIAAMSMRVPSPPLVLEVNKPFLFQLRFEDQGNSLVLFAGRVTDVLAAQ